MVATDRQSLFLGYDACHMAAASEASDGLDPRNPLADHGLTPLREQLSLQGNRSVRLLTKLLLWLPARERAKIPLVDRWRKRK